MLNCKRTSEGELITQIQIPAATCAVDRTPINVNVNIKHQSERHHGLFKKRTNESFYSTPSTEGVESTIGNSVCLSVCVSVRLSVITFPFFEYSII